MLKEREKSVTAVVAQWIERLSVNERVAGSIAPIGAHDWVGGM